MRPCFLILDSDFPASISSRKLVIETAKLNVITAYSPQEAVQTLERFPRVDGVVLNTHLEGRLSCRQVIDALHNVRGDIPIVTVSASGHDPCGGEQFHVSGYDPRSLLDVLQKMTPGYREAIRHDEETSEETDNGNE